MRDWLQAFILNGVASLFYASQSGRPPNWPLIHKQAQEKQVIILFGDEASFAQWGSLSHTWSPGGVQPTVKTSGIRKAYRVFGLLDCFGGKLYQRGLEGKFNSDSYSDFLGWVLSVVEGQIILIQSLP